MATRPTLPKTFPAIDPDYLARMRLATDEAKQIKAALARYPGGPAQIRAEQDATRADQNLNPEAPE